MAHDHPQRGKGSFAVEAYEPRIAGEIGWEGRERRLKMATRAHGAPRTPLPALRHAEKPTGPSVECDLPAAAPIAPPPVPSAPVAPAGTVAVPEAERRQLTVMFCDLVGSTALSTGMDPEDLRDVIASYQSRCSAVIRRYDGFVAKYMGDGILVYFGYPRAHEDEAERSVRAGLDIVDAMAELNAAIRRPPGVELAVRAAPAEAYFALLGAPEIATIAPQSSGI
jgi:hypothetical protein